MENFDEIYRKNFSNERESLSSSDDDQLWSSIVEELGPQNSIPTRKGPNIKKWRLPLLGLLLISVAYFVGQRHGSKNSIESTEINTTSGTKLNTNQETSVSKNIPNLANDKAVYESKPLANTTKPANDKVVLPEMELPSKVARERVSLETTSINSQHKPVSTSLVINTGQNTSNESIKFSNEDDSFGISNQKYTDQVTATRKSVTIEGKDITEVSTPAETREKSISVTGTGKNDESSGGNESKEGSTSGASSTESKRVENRLVSHNLIDNIDLFEIPITQFDTYPKIQAMDKVKKAYAIDFGLLAGANYSGLFYSGTDGDFVKRKNSTERGYWGYTYGIDAGVTYRNKWLVNIGALYEVQQSIYNEEFINNVTRKLESTTGILVNASNYNVLDEYKIDTISAFESQNRIQHVNSVTSLNVPFQLGWKSATRKHAYGILAGVNMRLRLDQQGRLLTSDGELFTLTSTSNTFSNPLNVGLMISPFYQYSLTKRACIRLTYNVVNYRPIVLTDQSLRLNNYAQSITIGIRYHM